jgi:lysophospholipase L1-like esterase
MRIAVLGNSDTTGQKLPDRNLSWPVLLQERLADELREDVTVDSWRFAPYRPEAVRYAMGLVQEAQPDILIYTLATYWCSFTTVGQRIERRLGRRAAELWGRAERRMVRRAPGGAASSGPAQRPLSKRIARKVIGAEPVLPYPRYIAVVSELIRELAKIEDMQVMVMADHHFNAAAREIMPAMERTIARANATIRPLVLERRFLWGSVEDALRDGPDRDAMIMADGVHITEEGHRRMVRYLVPRLQPMLAVAR